SPPNRTRTTRSGGYGIQAVSLGLSALARVSLPSCLDGLILRALMFGLFAGLVGTLWLCAPAFPRYPYCGLRSWLFCQGGKEYLDKTTKTVSAAVYRGKAGRTGQRGH